MTFDDLPSGERVFLDANIFLYHFLGHSAQCRRLLERCYQSSLRGVTASFVVAEVMHKLMISEAIERQLITAAQAVKKLRAHPEVVRQLEMPNQCVAKIAAMKIEIAPLTMATLEASAIVRRQHGLLTNDSLIIAAMQELHLQKLAMLDQDFARVSGLLVYQPTDVTPTT